VQQQWLLWLLQEMLLLQPLLCTEKQLMLMQQRRQAQLPHTL
jgi:hypothetical protein